VDLSVRQPRAVSPEAEAMGGRARRLRESARDRSREHQGELHARAVADIRDEAHGGERARRRSADATRPTGRRDRAIERLSVLRGWLAPRADARSPVDPTLSPLRRTSERDHTSP
jgi:hypothetical protein